MNKNKKYCIIFLLILGCLLLIVSSITIYIDPYFHYHAPNNKFDYKLENERYQNDGIARHFNYDAIITGTSMTQNFKASEMDLLFGVNSIKISNSGAFFKERFDLISRAIQYNDNLKIVINSLDFALVYWLMPYDKMRYENYPNYLYDDNIFNDVNYLFNKSVLFKDVAKVITNTDRGGFITSFDQYSNWNAQAVFSKKTVLENYSRSDKLENNTKFTVEEQKQVSEMLNKNIINLAVNNPDIEFYYFIPPYSIVWWDDVIRKGEFEKVLLLFDFIFSNLVEIENIKIFSYYDLFDVVTNLSNYKDITHYNQDINSYILNSMYEKTHMITKNNYHSKINEIENFYKNFDYDSIFE